MHCIATYEPAVTETELQGLAEFPLSKCLCGQDFRSQIFVRENA